MRNWTEEENESAEHTETEAKNPNKGEEPKHKTLLYFWDNIKSKD